MRPLFARRRQEASGIAVLGLWLSTIGEALANATAVHLDILKQDLSYTRRRTRTLARSSWHWAPKSPNALDGFSSRYPARPPAC
jgi:hypothetical protein